MRTRFANIILRIIEDLTDGLLILGPTGEIVFFNEMLLKITGWRSKEIFDREKDFLAHLDLEADSPEDRILRIPNPKDHYSWFRINSFKITGEEGTFRLIRIRKTREEDSESGSLVKENYEALFRNVSDPLLIGDLKGNIISANPAFFRMVECDEGDVLENVGDLYVYKTALEDKLIKVANTGDVTQMETYLYTKQKNVRRVLDNSWKISDIEGSLKGYTTHFKDVTYLKNLESRLQISEQNYVMLFDNIISAIILVGPSGKILNWNYAAEQLYGYKWEQIVGREFDSIFYFDRTRPPLKDVLEKVDKNEGRVVETNVPRLCHGGNVKYTYASYAWIRNTQDEVIAYAIMERDLTERIKLENRLRAAFVRIKETQSAAVLGFARLTEYRDSDTGKHLDRIKEYTNILASEMKTFPQYKNYITDDYIEDLCLASILHDVGKVGIDDTLLLKEDKLTAEEFENMKLHSRIGGEALAAIDKELKRLSFLTIGKEIAFYHHERWDGEGYPGEKKGDDIPLSARIIAITDAYDAMTSQKPYREALSHEKAVQEIQKEKGTHFDPTIVDAFLSVNDTFRRIKVFGEFQDKPETIDDLLRGTLKMDLSDLDLG